MLSKRKRSFFVRGRTWRVCYKPIDKQNRQASGHVDGAVVNRSGAGWDKALMEFVEQGVARNQQ